MRARGHFTVFCRHLQGSLDPPFADGLDQPTVFCRHL
jgi:hypothetical protein